MPTIAYLTSVYPRASDTFIRTEIAALRQQGFTVHTFAIRPPKQDQLISDEIKKEHAQTTYLLHGPLSLLFSAFCFLLSAFCHPQLTFRAAKLAHQLRWPGLKGHLWPFAYLLEAILLARHLRQKKIQHLHNHIGENSASVALLATTLAPIPHSHTIHGPYEFDSPHTFHLDIKIAHTAFTLAVSNFGRSQLYRWSHPDHWPKIHILHCTVTPEFLNHPMTPLPTDSSFRLVCVGRLCPEKGQLLLLESLAQLLHAAPMENGKWKMENLHLTLVGDGPTRPQLESRIVQLNLQKNVTITGWLPAAQVRQQILHAHAFVLPSFAEGLPVVLMEALALHRPVLSTTIAGIPELVIPNRTGWLVPPGSIESLTQALQQILQTPPARLAELAANGAALVALNHNPHTEPQKLATLLHQSIASSPSRP